MVLECMVSGTSFRKLDQVEAELLSTVQLEMKREGQNEFDHFAIALYFKEIKVGYIPKVKKSGNSQVDGCRESILLNHTG